MVLIKNIFPLAIKIGLAFTVYIPPRNKNRFNIHCVCSPRNKNRFNIHGKLLEEIDSWSLKPVQGKSYHLSLVQVAARALTSLIYFNQNQFVWIKLTMVSSMIKSNKNLLSMHGCWPREKIIRIVTCCAFIT